MTVLEMKISTDCSIMTMFSDTRRIAWACCSASGKWFATIETVAIVLLWGAWVGGEEFWREGRLEGKEA